MNRTTLTTLLPTLLLAAGCGGAMSSKAYDGAYAAPEAPEVDAPEAFAQMESERVEELSVSSDVDYMFVDDEIDGDIVAQGGSSWGPSQPAPGPTKMARSSKGDKKSKMGSSQQQDYRGGEKGKGKSQTSQASASDEELQEKGKDIEEPMVVYTGYLKLRVKRLLEAVDEVTALTEKRGGYIESLTSQIIVVRVPGEDFEAVLNAFAKIGEILDRRIKALDVSEQFTDLGARLAVAKEALARLMELLEKVEDVEERLLILQEIKRLSEQIDSTESTLATLKNLVDYYTITIELQPVLEASHVSVNRSPFPWVRDLAAHRTTIEDGVDEIAMTLPADFVLFEKDDVYRAQAADTTVIRAGVVDNEPRGDNHFWVDAVEHEMIGRGEVNLSSEDEGKVSYTIYKNEDVQPRYYLVGVYAAGEDLYVVEVFFPNEDAYEAHRDAVIEALGTLEVK